MRLTESMPVHRGAAKLLRKKVKRQVSAAELQLDRFVSVAVVALDRVDALEAKVYAAPNDALLKEALKRAKAQLEVAKRDCDQAQAALDEARRIAARFAPQPVVEAFAEAIAESVPSPMPEGTDLQGREPGEAQGS